MISKKKEKKKKKKRKKKDKKKANGIGFSRNQVHFYIEYCNTITFSLFNYTSPLRESIH